MCLSRFEHSVHIRDLEHSFKAAVQSPGGLPRWVVALGRVLGKLQRPRPAPPLVVPAE